VIIVVLESKYDLCRLLWIAIQLGCEAKLY